MSTYHTALAFNAEVPPLPKLLLIGLSENAIHPEDEACIIGRVGTLVIVGDG